MLYLKKEDVKSNDLILQLSYTIYKSESSLKGTCQNLDIFERWNVNPVTNYFSVEVSHLLSIKRALKSGREIVLPSLYEVFLTRNCSTWDRKEREEDRGKADKEGEWREKSLWKMRKLQFLALLRKQVTSFLDKH